MSLLYMDPGTDLFDTGAEALVNTVNCVGVMGAGVALGVKTRWPSVYRVYRDCCRRGEITPGSVTLIPTEAHVPPDGPNQPLYVLNLATKNHWRQPSQLTWIDAGLAELARTLVEAELDSVALPPPGCGHGGLNWTDVRPLIEHHLGDLDADIEVYAPARC